MKFKEDAMFVVKFCIENPKEATKIIAQAVLVTGVVILVGVLAVKGATELREDLQNRK